MAIGFEVAHCDDLTARAGVSVVAGGAARFAISTWSMPIDKQQRVTGEPSVEPWQGDPSVE
jgi:hypothetical protein